MQNNVIVRHEVSLLPLPPSLRQKLALAGYITVDDLRHDGAAQLAQGAQITLEEASEVRRVAADVASPVGANGTGAVTAQALFEKELSSRKIVTFCQELDIALGGGIATGQVTELCGQPAVGKTQLGIQLAVDVQLPKCFNGLGGKAIYIDTEGSFMTERAQDVADAFVAHLKRIAKHSNSAAKQALVQQLTTEKLLDGIQLFRVHDATELMAVVRMLPDLLAAAPEVKLVVLDSVAFPFRHGFTDMVLRTRTLGDMGNRLMQLANERDVAVVLMNQVTTQRAEDGSSKIIPALGDSWAHQATTRLILHWEGDQRRAHLYKSPSLAPATVDFFVTEQGIRGRKPQKRPRE